MDDPANNDAAMEESSPLPPEELLSNLMSALAAGARAVQGIPIDDEFEYQSSFPEFQNLVQENAEDLLDAILLALSTASGDEALDLDTEFQGLSDPLLWEACSDVCEWLTEQAEASGAAAQVQVELQSTTAKAKNSFGMLMQGMVKMPKPQEVYQIYSGQPYLNSRLEPFVPPITEKFHAIEPLDLTLQPGPGIANRFGAWRAPKQIPPNSMIAPSHHVPHVYRAEIEQLQFSDWQLAAPDSMPTITASTEPLEAMWVDTPQALQELTLRLETAKEIAMDLEAHNYRSFAGITCLIQITIGATDSEPKASNYLIDPFPLWKKLGTALGPALADPNIVKVMHGAESDVQWLQRDFGLYIVNLFDTYCAAKALEFPRLGYAHLLQTYVGVTPDKTHQLSDWRQRPLPPAMKEYAIMDTAYLLDIYKCLKFDLQKHKSGSIVGVFEKSKQICLIRYAPDVFKPEAYRTLVGRKRTKSELNETQWQVLKELYDWRDQMARQYDESLIYVCANSTLLRLALACPTTLAALQGLLQPMPPIILSHAKQLLGLVQRCVKPPFFKPATADPEDVPPEASGIESRSLMSPVLGTEALYRQAGWISPHFDDKNSVDADGVPDGVTTTTDDDEEEGEDGRLKPRRVLAVHLANQKYRSSQYTSHSLQLGPDDDDGDSVVDGTGSARAVHPNDLEEEAQMAQASAAHIRSTQEKHAMLGLLSAPGDLEDGDADDEGDDLEDEDFNEKASNEEHFVIPRSMREIYRISNHNRRKKKSSSPSLLEPNEKEAQELAKAEEILKARALDGKNYFDEIPGTPKRQRTKSTGTASVSSEDVGGTGHDSGLSREDDIAMMEEIGWIKGKEEIDSMMNQRDSAEEGEDDGDGAGASSEDDGTKQPKAFDYSGVGAIGAFSSTPSPNPFFSGAATAGGQLNQQLGKPLQKKQSAARGKQSRRGQQQQQQQQQPQQQVERPERNQARSQAYKKR